MLSGKKVGGRLYRPGTLTSCFRDNILETNIEHI